MVLEFNKEYESMWDEFVLKNSINGNFLQTRNFYNYHAKDKFSDASIILVNGDKIAAVIPACEEKEGKLLVSHSGSTFGGLIVSKNYANTKGYNWIFKEMVEYFRKKEYDRVELRMHHWLYSPDEKHHELLDYYFKLNGFSTRCEVGFFVDLMTIEEDYSRHFEKLKRRKLNKAKQNDLTFRKLTSDEETKQFYEVLSENMLKFNTVPVHTVEELIDFKNHRLSDVTSFYGVYYGEKMIAGSMVWNFCEKKVFHTQYLASLHDYLDFCPNEYLYANLILAAKEEGYRYLSYGTASLESGNIYNESLGMYKEGFNTDSYVNTCYIWKLKDNNEEKNG